MEFTWSRMCGSDTHYDVGHMRSDQRGGSEPGSIGGYPKMSPYDPNVWCGRALQEVFVDPVATVLHQCIRPLLGAHCAAGHHGYQRACDLISGQASTGPLGPQAVVVRVAMGGCTRARTVQYLWIVWQKLPATDQGWAMSQALNDARDLRRRPLARSARGGDGLCIQSICNGLQ